MFSLLISIISIALVAALALATLYYGGSSFNQGRAKAEASRLLNEQQQLLGAAELFRARTGQWPANLTQLVDGGYLKSIPTYTAGALPVEGGPMALAHADAVEWTLMAPGVPVFQLAQVVSEPVCLEVNRASSMGQAAIARGAYANLAVQCYGPSASELSIMATNSVAFLTGAVPGIISGGVPTGVNDPAWLVPPTLGDSNPTEPTEPTEPTPFPSAEVRMGGSIVNTVNFGGNMLGSPASRTLTVVNTGNTVLSLPANPAAGVSAPFSVSPGSCAGASLGVGSSCSFTVGYTPGSIGESANQSLGLSVGGASVPPIALQGQGLGSVARWDTTTLDFGSVNIFSGPYTRTAVVHNDGNTPGNFSLTPPPGVAASGCENVAAGTSCTMNFEYHPAGGVSYASGLMTPAGATQASNQLTVTGHGITPVVQTSEISAIASTCTLDSSDGGRQCQIRLRNNYVGGQMVVFYWGFSGVITAPSLNIAGMNHPVGESFDAIWANGGDLVLNFKIFGSGFHQLNISNYYVYQFLTVSVDAAGVPTFSMSAPL